MEQLVGTAQAAYSAAYLVKVLVNGLYTAPLATAGSQLLLCLALGLALCPFACASDSWH